MSASIYWEPVGQLKNHVNGGKSDTVEALRKAFGSERMLFYSTDRKTFAGMAAVYPFTPNPYQHILELLDKYEVIRLTVEY